ncbi:hypothetical protein HSRCO_0202 [Halanaeroarchaeum sp. HSR-CO]|uniref:hypothetical protein n=1 Tax=Halanaeroarchaeum sp. HSR-CO TaxID=2866382 RepID=UPI00217DA98F|nr:hypothetical protein [Halanaeroarchaeum sp. HSR-CO]UWG46504.1 hypothetical protein HSRCO_0202 [Halanaeroarchaeum sp. HSR-CO]
MGWVAKAVGAAIVASVLAVLVSMFAFGRPLSSSYAAAAISAAVAIVVVFLNR